MKSLLLLCLLAWPCASFAKEPPAPSAMADQFFRSLFSQECQICEDSCPYDFDDDGFVSADDMVSMLGMYGVETDLGCIVGDFDEDGLVTIDDFREFLPQWGHICE
jgi:hypothetical protein